MGNPLINREYKSSLFIKLFGTEEYKQNMLDLYNALANTNYASKDDLTFTTLDDAVYISVKNDVSFLIGNNMSLFEHQSTFNPNMPLRGFIYFAHLYQSFVEKCETSIYGATLIKIPTPQYIVLYNGTDKKFGDKITLKLSEAFINEDNSKGFEWTATVINVNIGHNKEIFDKCRVLWEYSMFIDLSRKYIDELDNVNDGVAKAVDECIEKGILKNYLTDKKAEVIAMCLFEFDQEKYERTVKNEGLIEGRIEGREEGIKKTIEILYSIGVSKNTIIEKLQEKYELTLPETEKYINDNLPTIN